MLAILKKQVAEAKRALDSSQALRKEDGFMRKEKEMVLVSKGGRWK